MADTKITALAAITTVDPAADVLPIVDVSDHSMAASGTTKNITTNQILGAGGTATLASATISGALDAARLNVTGATIPANGVYLGSANNLSFSAASTLGMTLNSTGLGVGGAPLSGFRLNVNNGDFRVSDVQNEDGVEIGWSAGSSIGFVQAYNRTTSAFKDLVLNAAVTINAAGQVGIGVTPSAWGGSYKALQLQSVARNIAATGAGLGDFTIAFNAIYDSTDSRWEYAGTGDKAGRYSQTGSGNHRWFVSNTAGTAGNEITDFASAAMTLDASGNLLVGTTSQNGSWNTKLTLSNDSGTTKWAVGPYLGGVTNFIISAGASTGVYLNGTAATSWTSASDERLKDIIEPISNAIAKVGSLRAVIGKFKFDENNTRKPFLIAQDIQAVLPEAVDASNPDRLGVAYTDVIPLLVAAIKELTTRVQTLEAR